MLDRRSANVVRRMVGRVDKKGHAAAGRHFTRDPACPAIRVEEPEFIAARNSRMDPPRNTSPTSRKESMPHCLTRFGYFFRAACIIAGFAYLRSMFVESQLPRRRMSSLLLNFKALSRDEPPCLAWYGTRGTLILSCPRHFLNSAVYCCALRTKILDRISFWPRTRLSNMAFRQRSLWGNFRSPFAANRGHFA